MRKAFNTSIEKKIQNEFKEKCKEENIPMNKVLEMFMERYVKGEFKIEMNISFKE